MSTDLFCNIHRDGYIFICIAGVTTCILFSIVPVIGVLFCTLTALIIYFFRDPQRVIIQNPHLILSPADGTIVNVQKTVPPESICETHDERYCISIFLSVFNVHINRVPINGKIKSLYYRKAKFIPAQLGKSSQDNERQEILIGLPDNKDLIVVQIAGIMARRIVCNLTEGQEVKAGEKFGIIKFGSRVDVYLPAGVEPLVHQRQTSIGGETVLADLGGQCSEYETNLV